MQNHYAVDVFARPRNFHEGMRPNISYAKMLRLSASVLFIQISMKESARTLLPLISNPSRRHTPRRI